MLLYNPQLFGFPMQRMILYPLSIIYFLLTGSELYEKEKRLLLIACACVCFGFTNSLIQGTGDFGMLLISRVFFGVLCANMIFDILKKGNYKINESTTLKLIGYTGLFQAIILIVAFFVPDFKSLLLEMNSVDADRDNVMMHLSAVRGIGWGTFQYAHMAILLGSSFLCYTYLVTVKNYTKSQNAAIIVSIIIYIIAGILAARTFFIILLVLGIYWYRVYVGLYGILNYLKIIFIGLVVSIIVLAVLFNQLKDYISEDTLKWAFEFFINYKEKGHISSGSTDVLATMWHFPDNIKTWLFGDARTAGLNGSYNYTLSDIGIVNSLYCWGIIGSFFYFLSLYKSFAYAANLSREKNIKIIIWLIFFINIGYQFKETLNLFPISCLFLRGELITNNNYRRSYLKS